MNFLSSVIFHRPLQTAHSPQGLTDHGMKATDLREKPQPTDFFALSRAQSISSVSPDLCFLFSLCPSLHPTVLTLISSTPNKGSHLLPLQSLPAQAKQAVPQMPEVLSLRMVTCQMELKPFTLQNVFKSPSTTMSIK